MHTVFVPMELFHGIFCFVSCLLVRVSQNTQSLCKNGGRSLTPSCPVGYDYKDGAGGCCANENRPKNVCPSGSIYFDTVTKQPHLCSAGIHSDPCPGMSVCNPNTGYCCAKLKICSGKGKRPEKYADGSKPKPCVAGCSAGYECQNTGFCCGLSDGRYGKSCVNKQCFDGTVCKDGICNCPTGQYRDSNICKPLPQLGQKCNDSLGCAGEYAMCLGTCQCMTVFGYVPDSTGKNCVRARRRLDEVCRTDAECKAAYSYCDSSKKCACLTGFRKDDQTGGCVSITPFKCGDGSAPLKTDGKIQECEKYPKHLNKDQLNEAKRKQRDPRSLVSDKFPFHFSYFPDMTHTCGEGAYCNAYYDEPRPDHYKGFCCKIPRGRQPTCPVGHSHSSSKAPDYGCERCPMTTYYCHSDVYATGQQICCAKPCKNPSDIYDPTTKQCYEPAGLNEPCEVDRQCVEVTSIRGSSYPQSANQQFQCITRVNGTKTCGCKMGYIEKLGKCTRAMCTVGLQGEPLRGRDKISTMRCIVSQRGFQPGSQNFEAEVCPIGYICDPEYQVCCHDVSGPPKPEAAVCPTYAPHATGMRCTNQQHYQCYQGTGRLSVFCYRTNCCSVYPV